MQSFTYNIYPLNRDLNAKWFVEFKLPDGKRPKKYGRLAHFETVAERMKEADKIVSDFISAHNVRALSSDVTYNNNNLIQAQSPLLANIREVSALLEIAMDNRSVYLRPKSIGTYKTKLLAFLQWYRINGNKHEVQTIGLGMSYIKYLRSMHLNHTTINAYRNTLKSLFGDIKAIRPNPFDELKKLRETRKSYKYFNEDQQAELMDKISTVDPQLWLACQFEYYLLLRPDELRTIRVGAFNLASCSVCVDGDISKNGKTQYVNIPSEFIDQLDFLQDYPPHFYVFGNKGKPGLTPHGKKHFPDLHQTILKVLKYNTRIYKYYSWKHTGAVMYYLATGDVKGLKEQGRWHSLDMVNEYLKNLGALDIQQIQKNFPKIGQSKLRRLVQAS